MSRTIYIIDIYCNITYIANIRIFINIIHIVDMYCLPLRWFFTFSKHVPQILITEPPKEPSWVVFAATNTLLWINRYARF